MVIEPEKWVFAQIQEILGFSYIFKYLFHCTCLFVPGGFESTMVHMWRSDNNPQELTLPFCHWRSPELNSGHQAWRQVPTLLSHVAKSTGSTLWSELCYLRFHVGLSRSRESCLSLPNCRTDTIDFLTVKNMKHFSSTLNFALYDCILKILGRTLQISVFLPSFIQLVAMEITSYPVVQSALKKIGSRAK